MGRLFLHLVHIQAACVRRLFGHRIHGALEDWVRLILGVGTTALRRVLETNRLHRGIPGTPCGHATFGIFETWNARGHILSRGFGLEHRTIDRRQLQPHIIFRASINRINAACPNF